MMPYLRLLRVHQWLKNLMLFFPPFLSGALLHPALLHTGWLPLASFCLASSATYVFNDVMDIRRDRHHPVKQNRPVASGRVSRLAGGTYAFLLAASAVSLGCLVPGIFLPYLGAYLIISVSYSILLKELPIVDIFCIAAGFLLRLLAGGSVFGVVISEWLFLSVFLLSLFLGTGKRLCEKNALADGAANHRRSLEGYPEGFLEMAMTISGAAVLVTYAMYTISRHALIYTVPLCTFGILRYALRVKGGGGGDPTDALLRDLPLFFTGLIWVILVAYGIYR